MLFTRGYVKEPEAKFPTFRPKFGPFRCQDSPMELLPIDSAWLVRTQGLCYFFGQGPGGSRGDFMFSFEGI